MPLVLLALYHFQGKLWKVTPVCSRNCGKFEFPVIPRVDCCHFWVFPESIEMSCANGTTSPPPCTSSFRLLLVASWLATLKTVDQGQQSTYGIVYCLHFFLHYILIPIAQILCLLCHISHCCYTVFHSSCYVYYMSYTVPIGLLKF